MKRTLILLLLLLFTVTAFFALSINAESPDTVTLDRALLSEDGTTLSVSATLTEDFSALHSRVYLFRVTPNNESIRNLTPIAEAVTQPGEIVFTLPYDNADHATALYGYVLANLDSNGTYHPLSEAVYISNLADFAPNTKDYPTFTSKKGLHVQYVADAQLLGVSHSVVYAFFNELITEEEENAEGFVYGGIRYFIDKEALSTLDYRIKTLSDAGIHVYMNLLLAYDPTAPADLYYPGIQGIAGALYMPNVSTPDSIRRFAAVIHFLTERYTLADETYGFCGSFILGYEVNNETDRNRAAITELSAYTDAYATLLRVADLATHTSYRNARLFVSVSNRYIVSEMTTGTVFGAKEFLLALIERLPSLPFGIAINPYPSSLSQTAYWNDEKATDRSDTEYLTMKNIGILTDFLSDDAMHCQGELRPIAITEFGLSGKGGDPSEQIQAAAYLYAYHTVQKYPLIESFIWHRHVDHSGELQLYYGLYTSSDLLLEPVNEKTIYTVFGTIDTDNEDAQETLLALIELLPSTMAEELAETVGSFANRTVTVTKESSASLSDVFWKDRILYDFSKSLYEFYPTDNAEYLELCTEDEITFLRASILTLSSIEYGGIGIPLTGNTELTEAGYLTLRLRIGAKTDTADIRLVLTDRSQGHLTTLHAIATISCGDWVDVTFSLSEAEDLLLNEASLKLWVRTASPKSETVFLDVASITLHTEKEVLPMFLFLGLLVIAILSLLGVFVFVAVRRTWLTHRK